MYDIPYAYNDYCIDDYVTYLKCSRGSPKILENVVFYTLPFSNTFTRCNIYKQQWKKC